GHDMVAGLQRRQHGGRYCGHAGRGRAAGFRAFELDHAALEHRDGRIGIARIDEAGVLALEARLALLGSVVDIALGEEQSLGRLSEFGAKRAGMNEAGFGTVVRRLRRGSRLEVGRTGHVTSTWPPKAATKKPAWENSSRPGSHVSPACLA